METVAFSEGRDSVKSQARQHCSNELLHLLSHQLGIWWLVRSPMTHEPEEMVVVRLFAFPPKLTLFSRAETEGSFHWVIFTKGCELLLAKGSGVGFRWVVGVVFLWGNEGEEEGGGDGGAGCGKSIRTRLSKLPFS